jgi:hypothetical protein
MDLVIPDKKFFLNDEVSVYVSSNGQPMDGVEIYLNHILHGETDEGYYAIENLPGGDHMISVKFDGYYEVSAPISVSDDSYATSRDVRSPISETEKQKANSDGKAIVSFYETSFCTNCDVVRRKLNIVVDKNRDCLVYEKLSYWKYRDRLWSGSLPFITIDGRLGTYKANGLVKMESLKGMMERASGCEIQ